MGLSCLGITAGLSKGLQCPHAVTCFQTHADPGEEDSCWDFLPRDSPSAALHPTWLKPPGLPQSSGDPEPELTSHRAKSEDEGTVGAVPGEGGFGGMHLSEFGNKREECLPRDLRDTVRGTGHESSPNILLQQVYSPGQGDCRRTPSARLEWGQEWKGQVVSQGMCHKPRAQWGETTEGAPYNRKIVYSVRARTRVWASAA